jgi:hypothetical protein
VSRTPTWLAPTARQHIRARQVFSQPATIWVASASNAHRADGTGMATPPLQQLAYSSVASSDAGSAQNSICLRSETRPWRRPCLVLDCSAPESCRRVERVVSALYFGLSSPDPGLRGAVLDPFPKSPIARVRGALLPATGKRVRHQTIRWFVTFDSRKKELDAVEGPDDTSGGNVEGLQDRSARGCCRPLAEPAPRR